MALKKILIVADRRMQETPAFRQGVMLAELCGAAVHLCMFDYEPTQDAPPAGKFSQARKTWVADRVAEMRRRGLAADGEYVETMSPDHVILARSVQLQPDLVVRDLHELERIEWLEFRPDEKEVVEHCPVPILMVRPESPGLPGVVLGAVTASGTDAQPVSEAVAETARDFGAAIGAKVHLAHIYPHAVAAGRFGMQEVDSASREADRERFEQLARQFDMDPEFSHWVDGKPADAIAKFVNELGAGWLVMGSVYHSLLAKFRIELLGSTTDHVVGRTRCDVLFVKPAGFLEELGRHLDIDAICRECTNARAAAA